MRVYIHDYVSNSHNCLHLNNDDDCKNVNNWLKQNRKTGKIYDKTWRTIQSFQHNNTYIYIPESKSKIKSESESETVKLRGGGTQLHATMWNTVWMPLILILGLMSGIFVLITLIATAPISLLPLLLTGIPSGNALLSSKQKWTVNFAYIMSVFIQLLFIVMLFFICFFYISRGILMFVIDHKCDKKMNDGTTRLGANTHAKTLAHNMSGIVFIAFLLLSLIPLSYLLVGSSGPELGYGFLSGLSILFSGFIAPGSSMIAMRFVDTLTAFMNHIRDESEEYPQCNSPKFKDKMKMFFSNMDGFKKILEKLKNAEGIEKEKLLEFLRNPTKHVKNENNIRKYQNIFSKINGTGDNGKNAEYKNSLIQFANYFVNMKDVKLEQAINIFDSCLTILRPLFINGANSTEWKTEKQKQKPFLLSFTDMNSTIMLLGEIIYNTYCQTSGAMNTFKQYMDYNILTVSKLLATTTYSVGIGVILVLLIIIISGATALSVGFSSV